MKSRLDIAAIDAGFEADRFTDKELCELLKMLQRWKEAEKNLEGRSILAKLSIGQQRLAD